MDRIRKIAVFLFVWLIAAQVFAAVPSPRLSVVQREHEINLLFSWNEPVDFSEKNEAGKYLLTFLTPLMPTADRVRQISAALPEKWRKINLSQQNGSSVFSVDVPENGRVFARKDASGVRVSMIEVPAKKPEEKRKLPVKRPETQVEAKAVPPPVVAKEAPAGPEQEIIEDNEEKKRTPVQIDLSSLPYAGTSANVSLTLSKPKILEDGDKDGGKEFQPENLSGYRAASLSFSWTRMTAAAAFRRDGYVWIVFDRKEDFDFSLERELYKDIIREMIQIPHSHATIYRLVTEKGYNPSLRREGLLWVVDLMYQPVRARKSVDLILQRKSPFGPRIFVPLDEAPQIVPLIDPEVGDLMYIVPIFALNRGIQNPRNFVDVSFPATAQGMVIIPNIEDLNVYASTSGVEIRGPKDGMRFSSEDILSFLEKSKINADPLSQILDVSAWATNKPDDYLKDLKTLQENVINADKKDKDVKRLILARYYFANGMYPEALDIIRVVIGNPAFANLPGVVALRGAINFMMKRYDEAIRDLSSPLLKNDMASEYWRAATLAASSRTPDKYLQPMKDNMAILQAYPYPVKTQLALAGLHAAVAGADEFSIQNFMEAAYNSQNTSAENDEVSFYHALWQESTGMYSLARSEMKRLAEGANFYFRAMGGLEKIRMDTRSRAISPEERIEELEHLSYAWRGGEFEYNLMTMLVSAYREQKNYSQVLHILRDMEVRFNGMPEGKKIRELMEDVFLKIYMNESDEALPPVKAIALYDEFKDLTPPGEKGARIVRLLADRLVSIDLLDRAASLLDDQLSQPMIGQKERGLISTRLALVRLLNKEPEKALDALKISEKSKFSDRIRKQRLYIQAKALADLKKPDEAAALLEEDDSQEAKMLRAEIYWQAQIWDKAADALKLLITKPQPDVPLTQQEAQHVLDWAAALRLAGRSKVVMRLRENFMPYMEKTNLAQAFDFITKTPQQGLLDYHQVAKEVESAESFHSFAKEYTDMIKTKGLSETVR